jgi:hypothetical protein
MDHLYILGVALDVLHVKFGHASNICNLHCSFIAIFLEICNFHFSFGSLCKSYTTDK